MRTDRARLFKFAIHPSLTFGWTAFGTGGECRLSGGALLSVFDPTRTLAQANGVNTKIVVLAIRAKSMKGRTARARSLPGIISAIMLDASTATSAISAATTLTTTCDLDTFAGSPFGMGCISFVPASSIPTQPMASRSTLRAGSPLVFIPSTQIKAAVRSDPKIIKAREPAVCCRSSINQCGS